MATEPKTTQMGIQDVYQLRLLFGDEDIALTPHTVEEFSITLDINRFLPAFRLRMLDSQGLFVHLSPLDHSISKISVEIRRGIASEEQYNRFDFDVYKRTPDPDTYDIQGLLSIDGLFSPERCRGFSGNIKSNLETIASDDLGIENTDVSILLDYDKKLVQPSWTNAQFLNYLKNNISGENGETCWYTFIKNIFISDNSKAPIFVFKCYNEFTNEKPKYNFMIGGQAILKNNRGKTTSYYPVFDYDILDNYKVIGIYGNQTKTYSYFNYSTSQFVNNSVSLNEYFSLSEFLLIDKDDPDNSVDISTGRSNDFTEDFAEKATGQHYRRTTDLVKMWITVWGLESIAPGDIVKLKIALPSNPDFELNYQYQGYWMVERVVHMFGMGYTMRLLLTRGGIDTLYNTSLVPAIKRKKEIG